MTSRIDIIGQNGNDGLAYLADVGDEQQHVSSSHAELNHIADTSKKVSMAELYPKYYKDFTGVDEADVYLVHDRFQIDDPSGCIHHASKKLLLCGVRTGGKNMATEIKEARDTLTRKLQLMGVE
jgi:hypothetical protein